MQTSDDGTRRAPLRGLLRGLSRIRRPAVLVLALAAAAMLPAPAANAAAGDPSRISTTTAVRSCADTRCAQIATASAGSSYPTSCWRDGGFTGNTVRWFRMNVAGVVGWVNLTYVDRQAQVPYCSDMLPGDTLWSGQSIWSANGRYQLLMQGDGNLVEYGPGGPIWATSTNGAGQQVIMQGDSNLVVYGNRGASWATGTNGFSGVSLVVQDDGNIVMYSNRGAIWASLWHVAPAGAVRASYNWAQQYQTQCTFYALEKWREFSGRHDYPSFRYGANAGSWPQAIAGWTVSTTPMTQALVVWPGEPGHVGWVLSISPNPAGGFTMLVTDRNYDLKGTTRASVLLPVTSNLRFIPAPAI